MGKWVKGKRILATGMSLVLCVPATLGTTGLSVFAAGENEEVEEVVVPEPYYEFTFDEGVEGENQNLVPNEGTKEGISAVIDGNGEGLGIVDDSERNSKVLNLPGDALNAGCLLLPSEMFSDVGQEGFAFSFWIFRFFRRFLRLSAKRSPRRAHRCPVSVPSVKYPQAKPPPHTTKQRARITPSV